MSQNVPVSARPAPATIQAAANLPSTVLKVVTGSVSSSSIEPLLRSSAHSRMAIAGTRKQVEPGMKLEESVEGRLTAVEEAPEEERQRSGEGQEHDDEHVGDRGREIAGQLAPADGPDVAQGVGGARGGGRWSARRRAERRAPDPGAPPPAVRSRNTSSRSPRHGRSRSTGHARSRARCRDRRQDLPAVRGDDGQRPERVAGIALLHARYARQRLQLGANRRGPLAGQRKTTRRLNSRDLSLEVLGRPVRDESARRQ